MHCNVAGHVLLKLKSARFDGTPHFVKSWAQFMQRLAARVPRPRLPLIRSLGVLASNARLRPKVLPMQPQEQAQASQLTNRESARVHCGSTRICWVRLLKRVFGIEDHVIAVTIPEPLRGEASIASIPTNGTARVPGQQRL